jgi:transposase InsO family protein
MKASIKILHTDRGGEYLSEVFDRHLKDRENEGKLTVHDTPEHNGVSERLNGILMENRLHDSGLPKFLWSEAVRHAVWLKNRMSTKALNGNAVQSHREETTTPCLGLPNLGA